MAFVSNLPLSEQTLEGLEDDVENLDIYRDDITDYTSRLRCGKCGSVEDPNNPFFDVRYGRFSDRPYHIRCFFCESSRGRKRF